jgi:hypothetical protein
MKFKVTTENRVTYDSTTGEKREFKSIWIQKYNDDDVYNKNIALICGKNDDYANLLASAPELLEKLNMAIGYIENTENVNESFLNLLKHVARDAEGKES